MHARIYDKMTCSSTAKKHKKATGVKGDNLSRNTLLIYTALPNSCISSMLLLYPCIALDSAYLSILYFDTNSLCSAYFVFIIKSIPTCRYNLDSFFTCLESYPIWSLHNKHGISLRLSDLVIMPFNVFKKQSKPNELTEKKAMAP